MFPGRFDGKDDQELIKQMPFLILYSAEKDPFKLDADDLAAKFRGKVIVREYPNCNHAFYHDSNLKETEEFFTNLK